MVDQLSLLPEKEQTPSGFSYYPDFISPDEEQKLLTIIKELSFSSFEMHGVEAKRKIIHYGMKYDFQSRSASSIGSIPVWLSEFKRRSEILIGKEIPQVLVTFYPVGSAIGWHQDAPPFESLLGISLLNSCRFQLRRGEMRNWEKYEISLGPRSAYIVKDEARWKWQHHIPPVKAERYSITFRTIV